MVHEDSLKKIIYIVGPTASGKTDLSLELCKHINGEIIGADSMQIYKHIKIGTAKPTKEEIGDAVYHFIDFVEPDSIYTVSQFKDDALSLIGDIHKRGAVPIVCGGTGLYVNSLIYKMDFTNASFDLEFRKQLESKSKDQLLKMLKEMDVETYNKIDIHNLRRVTRAIEICHLSKLPKSAQVRDYKQYPREFDHRVFILNMDRKLLYDRINSRVNIMVEKGLVDEVQMLMDRYKDTSYPIFQFIGYKEIVAYLNGEIQKCEAIEAIKQNTRRFAKRQLTWFKGITGVKNTYWIDMTDANILNKIIELSK